MDTDKEAVGLSRVHMYECKCVLPTARMHTISRQFIPLIYGPLGKGILSKIQPTLPFL